MKQQSSSKELLKETMFLGVSLYDQFLSKGYFKNQRSLQIAGIASLTLATRIEENQPFNRSNIGNHCIEGEVKESSISGIRIFALLSLVNCRQTRA